MSRDDRDPVLLIIIATSIVGALGAALFWGDPIAAAVLVLLGGGAWWLRRFVAASRQRDAEFEAWRTSPDTIAQFLRRAGYDDEPWEGVQSSGPDEPEAGGATLTGVVGRYGWPGDYLQWGGDKTTPTAPWGRSNESGVIVSSGPAVDPAVDCPWCGRVTRHLPGCETWAQLIHAHAKATGVPAHEVAASRLFDPTRPRHEPGRTAWEDAAAAQEPPDAR